MNEKPNNDVTIVFDLGGVLIDWNPRHLYRNMFNGDDQDMHYFLSVVCPLDWNEKMDAGRPFAEAVHERSLEYPNYEPYIRAYQNRWIEMVGGEIKETVSLLADLKKRGYPLYALSNWSAETFPLVKDQFQFLEWFDDLVISGEIQMAKPDPAIFNYLLRQIERPADACLFIDDNERNIATAQAMGFDTIHFSSATHLREELLERSLLD